VSKSRQIILALQLLWALGTFLLMSIVKIALLDLPGLFIVPFVIRCRTTLRNISGTCNVITVPRSSWCWFWSNDEDGMWPTKAQILHPEWPLFWQMYAWLALRNRTDNLQFSWLCPPSIPEKVWWIWLPWGWSKGGFICGQGLLCYVWTPLPKWFPKFEAVSLGWNRYPADKVGLKETDPRRYGCGFGGRYTPKGGKLT